MLDRLTRSMGRKFSVSVALGNSRSHEPAQATKFAFKSGVIIRTQLPNTFDFTQEKF